MDIVVGFPQTQKQYDSIWVVVDWLTKFSNFIPIKCTYMEKYYAKIFIDGIVCRHDIMSSIISYRGAQFTSKFWRSFQKGLGTTVMLSIAFHPQTDCQAERTI